MVTKTVEYSETVEREEELDLCNDCHREVDEAGVELQPPEGMDESVIHLCSECFDKLVEEDIKPAHIQRAEDWLTEERGYCNGGKYITDSVESAVMRASRKFDTITTGLIVLGIVLTILISASIAPFRVTVIGYILLTTVSITYIHSCIYRIKRIVDEAMD